MKRVLIVVLVLVSLNTIGQNTKPQKHWPETYEEIIVDWDFSNFSDSLDKYRCLINCEQDGHKRSLYWGTYLEYKDSTLKYFNQIPRWWVDYVISDTNKIVGRSLCPCDIKTQ